MKTIDHTKNIFHVLVAACVISFIAGVFTISEFVYGKHRVVTQTKQEIGAESDRLAGALGKGLSEISSSILSIREDMLNGTLSQRDLNKRLEKTLDISPYVMKAGVVFADPAENTGDAGKDIEVGRKDVKTRSGDNVQNEDYRQSQWYKSAVENGEGWSDPYFDEETKNYIVYYAAPIYSKEEREKNAKPADVIYGALSLVWLKEHMESADLENRIFGVVLSKKGTILYHPVNDLVFGKSNIFDMLDANKANNINYDRQRANMQKAINGESGSGYMVGRNGQARWYCYRPIPSAGWSVSINFMKDLSAFNGKKIRQKQINILLWMIAFILLLASILMGLYDVKRIKKPKLWAIAGAFSLLCITAACYTLHLSYAVPINEYQQDKIVVEDDISLNRFIGMSTKLSQSVCKKDPLFIPTGIHVQSMEFSTANNVSISGYIWQKYTKGIHDGISRGVIFPEAKTVSMNEMYRSDLDNGKVELIGWYFEATIRQDLDYSKFPFDQPNVSIWLRHKDFYNNIILIPDLKGYQFMNAIARPGIQGRLAMPGYALLGSFFSYTSKMMNANFGMDSFRKEARWPELFYNVLMKRNFITPLVSKFFPILIVISMLFIVLMSFSTDSAKQKNFGLTGFAVIGLVVSFFFSTLLTQIDLRQQFSADGIIFIENFNFLTYLMLLFSAVQAFVFSAEKKIWFIQYEHCLLPKLLYWPLFGFLVLCASLIYFY